VRACEDAAIDWRISTEPVPYEAAVQMMEERVRLIAEGAASELVWLLEHPPLYTAGTSADPSELIDPGRFPVYETGRGGKLTYHGPGQRIVYVMVDVRRRFGGDVHAFVHALEDGVIAALAPFGIAGERRAGRIGVWVALPGDAGGEAKIAAIGVRVRRGISFHGLALNVAPDLSHFAGIVPCGIRDRGVTSIASLGKAHAMKDVDISLRRALGPIFEARMAPLGARGIRPETAAPGPTKGEPGAFFTISKPFLLT
jgi:lipoyl(octanoyl) transferase